MTELEVALKAMLKYVEFDAVSKCCPVCGGNGYHDSACMLAAFLYQEKAKSYERHIRSTHIHDILFDVENDKRLESLRDDLYQVPGYVNTHRAFDDSDHPDNHGFGTVADHINKLAHTEGANAND